LFLFVVAFTFIVTVSSLGQLQFSDLKLAIDAGLIRYIASGQRSADFATIVAAENISNFYVNVVDCVASPTFYPFPDPTTADREFKRILKSQVLYLADVAPVDVTADYYLFFNKTLAYVNANYGTSITYQVVVYDTSVAVFAGLLNGEVDLTSSNFLEGGFYLNYRRNQIFPRSCVFSASIDFLYVLNATTTLQVITSTAGTAGTICAEQAGSFQEFAAAFGATNIVIEGAPGTCVPGVLSGQYIATNVADNALSQVLIPNQVDTTTIFYRARPLSLPSGPP